MKAKANKPRKCFFPQGWLSNFLSNVLGVIVGIALTFGISYLIQHHQEKADRLLHLINSPD
ncbi:MAG: hypothetical protein LBS05_06345 [Tannerellaceae bacterium]|jgi:hypothetical protein|nr:hypothetical protein [Tannerellaceae bacterium]